MRERAVRLRHFMRVIAFLDGVALAGCGVFEFVSVGVNQSQALTTVGKSHNPARG